MTRVAPKTLCSGDSDDDCRVQQLVNAGSKRSRREPEAIDVDDEQTVVASKRPRGAL